MMFWLRLSSVVVLAAWFIVAQFGCAGDKESIVRASQKTSLAPNCSLTSFTDTQRHELGDIRAKVRYVDFWASWCGPCAQSFPFMNAMTQEFRERGLQIVGINVDEHADAARTFLQQHPAEFRILADATGVCPKAFRVMGMPSSYLIDRNGVIRYVHVGFRPGETGELRKQVEKLLAE
jgi:thiol-disulfide isomerase/thioredoxin